MTKRFWRWKLIVVIIVNFVGSLRSLFQDQLLVFCVRWIQRVCQYGPGLGRKGKVWILHLIDAATATIYTAACFIRRKKECCKCVVYFRYDWLFSEHLVNFIATVVGDLQMMYSVKWTNIKTSTTPGESPFSNGVVRSDNKVSYEALMKTMEYAKCDMETALAWSV